MSIIRFDAGGWRARVDDGFDEAGVTRVATALGKIWSQHFEGSTVMVGYDARRDSKRFARLVGEVLAAYGLRTIVSEGICPTPVLGWAVAHDPACIGGVMLTATRLPHEYGGILIRQADGGPVSSAFAAAVAQQAKLAPTSERGTVAYADLLTPYIDNLVSETDGSLIASAHLRVVVDPLHAAGSGCVADLFERLGCEVVRLHDKAVPDFRGMHPEAREPWVDACERTVRERHADLGMVFDGDCGRFSLIDSAGKLVSSHDVAPLVLEHIVRQRGRRGRVVGTVATSARLSRQAERLGCEYTMVAVGREALYREFFEGDVVLAADENGGICIPQHASVRDGILAATMLLELIAGTGDGVRDLIEHMEEEVGHLEYVACDMRLDFGATQRLRNMLPGLNPDSICGDAPVWVSHADGMRLTMPDGAWLLLRASHTGAGVHVCAEGEGASRARALLTAARALVS